MLGSLQWKLDVIAALSLEQTDYGICLVPMQQWLLCRKRNNTMRNTFCSSTTRHMYVCRGRNCHIKLDFPYVLIFIWKEFFRLWFWVLTHVIMLKYTNISEERAAFNFSVLFPSCDKRCKGPENGLLPAYHCNSPDQASLILVLGGHLSLAPSTRSAARAFQGARAVLISFSTNCAEPKITWLGINRVYGGRIPVSAQICYTWNFQSDQ